MIRLYPLLRIFWMVKVYFILTAVFFTTSGSASEDKNLLSLQLEKSEQVSAELSALGLKYRAFDAAQKGIEAGSLPTLRNPEMYDRQSSRWKTLQLFGEPSVKQIFSDLSLPPVQSRGRSLDRLKILLRDTEGKPNAETLRGLCLGSLALLDADEETTLVCARKVAKLAFENRSDSAKKLLQDFTEDRAGWSLNQNILVALILSPALVRAGLFDNAITLIRDERMRKNSSKIWVARSYFVEGGLLYGSGRSLEAFQIWRSLVSGSSVANAQVFLRQEEIDSKTKSLALLSLARAHKVRGQLLYAVGLYEEILSEPKYFELDVNESDLNFFKSRTELGFMPELSIPLDKDQINWEYSETLLALGKPQKAYEIQKVTLRAPGLATVRGAAIKLKSKQDLEFLSRLLNQLKSFVDDDKSLVENYGSQINLAKKEALPAKAKFQLMKSSSLAIFNICSSYAEFYRCQLASGRVEKWNPLLRQNWSDVAIQLSQISDLASLQIAQMQSELPLRRQLFHKNIQKGLESLFAQMRDTSDLVVLYEKNPIEKNFFEKEVGLALAGAKDRAFEISKNLQRPMRQINLESQTSVINSAAVDQGINTAKWAALKYLASLEMTQQIAKSTIGRTSLKAMQPEFDQIDEQLTNQKTALLLQRISFSRSTLDFMSKSDFVKNSFIQSTYVQLASIAKFMDSLERRSANLPTRDVLSQSIKKNIVACVEAFREIKTALLSEEELHQKSLQKTIKSLDHLVARVLEIQKLHRQAQIADLVAWEKDIQLSFLDLDAALKDLDGELNLSFSALATSGLVFERQDQDSLKESFQQRERMRALQRWKLESGVFR